MGIKSLSSPSDAVGAVFTPLAWADWALKELDVLSKFHRGSTVCDPTAGNGVFIIALVRQYIAAYGEICRDKLRQLYLIEKEPFFLEQFQLNFLKEFGIEFPISNILLADVIRNNPKIKFDVIIGNPPWVNFNDLDGVVKQELKAYYVQVGLVKNLKNVLLGGSRIDIAALILYCVFIHNTNKNAECGFFLPMSLFLNDGASTSFRNFRVNDSDISLDQLYDFNGTEVFDGVSTRFCFAKFSMNKKTNYPISYVIRIRSAWLNQYAAPIDALNSPLVITADSGKRVFSGNKVKLQEWQQPRQGVNTCGANHAYIVDKAPTFVNPSFVYPLVTTKLLRGSVFEPEKFVIIPYHKDGKPLSTMEMRREGLFEHFLQHKICLENRKGVLINTMIRKGCWWALMGVGPYSFSAYKIIWTAFGGKKFDPIILSNWQEQEWQGNQAMQAFIPSAELGDAKRVLGELLAMGIEERLRQHKMEGTMNWAQPGRIKRFLDLGQAEMEL